VAQQSPDNRIVIQAPLTRIWSGNGPSPEDLLAQIRGPFQLKQFRERLEIEWFRHALSTDFVVETPLLRFHPITPKKLLDTFGVRKDFHELEKDMTTLNEALQKLLAEATQVDS
jgi:hypothetical protein